MYAVAKAKAKNIIDEFGFVSPNEIDLELIAADMNVYIDSKKIEGAEGRITHNGKYGYITVNNKIKLNTKIKFIIAHELGHFKLHFNNNKFYNCSSNVFSRWTSINDPETEANTFAAELLMPESMFLKKTKAKYPSTDLIKQLANEFNSSIIATAFRYSDIGQHPTAIIYCQDGKIKWSNSNKDFRYKFIRPGNEVSKNSYVYNYFYEDYNSTRYEKVLLDAWYLEDNNYKKDKYIFEQMIYYPEFNGVLVLLWDY